MEIRCHCSHFLRAWNVFLFLFPLFLTIVLSFICGISVILLLHHHHDFRFTCVRLFSADTPLFTCQDGSDSVFNRTDQSVDLPNDNEERDVLTDMPRDSSAVNRFDRFLKERKDSELLNLMALRREMDDGGIEGAEYVKVGY